MNKLRHYLNTIWGIFEEHFYFCEVEEWKWQEAAADKADAGEHQALNITDNG